MVDDAREIKFAQILSELLEQRYPKNRAKLAIAAGISPSALSQYISRRTAPSLPVLVRLATTLDVSLDFLVYGVESPRNLEQETWVSHLESTFRKVSSQADAVRQSVNRVGMMLAGEIQTVVAQVVGSTGTASGAITAREVVQLERYATQIKMATIDIGLDLVVSTGEVGQDSTAPGPFLDVIASNIINGSRYEYILPSGRRWHEKATLLASKVERELATRHFRDRSAIEKLLNFYSSDTGLVPSYVIYTLDAHALALRSPVLFDLLKADIVQLGDDQSSTLAVIEPLSLRSDLYYVLGANAVEQLCLEYEHTRRQSTKMDIYPGLPASKYYHS